MRSFILPLAILASSVLAAPKPAEDCVTKGDQVIKYFDVTVTDIVYVTEGAVPASTYVPTTTTKRRKHKHKPSAKPVPSSPAAYYAPAPPAPTEETVTVTYGYQPYQPPVETQAPPVETPVASAPVASAPVAPDTKPSSTGDLQVDILAIHNFYRAKYNVPLLDWNDDIASYAADHTGDCVMHHTDGPYGENLGWGYSDAIAGVEAWYGEYNEYNYQAATFDGNSGHFTQVIWKGTTQVGCYIRDCSGTGYLMCEYLPRGNMLGSYTENVPELPSGTNPN